MRTTKSLLASCAIAALALATGANAGPCGGRVKVANLYTAFLGPQEGLLLINRPGASFDQIHPTNAGYRAITQAFMSAQ